MALVADMNVKELVETLRSNVAAIGASLPERQLYDDMLAFGKAFAEMDTQGEHVEIKLLGDILAELAHDQRNMPYEYIVSVVDAEIKEAHSHPPRSVDEMMALIDTLPSLKLIADACRQGSEQAHTAGHAFTSLVDLYILRDGTLSSDELKLISHIEELFA
jgi:hypothetical protein